MLTRHGHNSNKSERCYTHDDPGAGQMVSELGRDKRKAQWPVLTKTVDSKVTKTGNKIRWHKYGANCQH